jgi:hypothetical protein
VDNSALPEMSVLSRMSVSPGMSDLSRYAGFVPNVRNVRFVQAPAPLRGACLQAPLTRSVTTVHEFPCKGPNPRPRVSDGYEGPTYRSVGYDSTPLRRPIER